jgi:hypothetical protein
MKEKPPKVEPKGWGGNGIKVTPTDLQHNEREKIEMNMSTQRHGNLYKSKKILHMHYEIQKSMETRSTTKGSAW